MPAYNTTFELTIEDIDLIETALLDQQRRLNGEGDVVSEADPKDISELLGRLHNQKIHYRPSEGVYVGG